MLGLKSAFLAAAIAYCCCYDCPTAKAQNSPVEAKAQKESQQSAIPSRIDPPTGCAAEQCTKNSEYDYSQALVSALTLLVLVFQWRTYVNQMKTSRAIERGWIEVVMSGAGMDGLRSDLGESEICVPHVNIFLKNSGRTPVWVTSRSFLFQKLDQSKLLPATPTYNNVVKCFPPFPLNPGATWPVQHIGIPIAGSISKLDYVRICRREVNLVFATEIRYRDIFGKDHMTRVLAQWEELSEYGTKQFMWRDQKDYNVQT